MPEASVSRTIAALVWAVVVVASWAGFGGVAARWARARDAGPGLKAAWGMAIVVFVGGLFNAFQICSPATIGGLTVVGFVLALADLVRRPPRPRITAALVPLVLIVAYGALMVVASSALHGLTLNAIDDDTTYQVLPKKMLQTGAAIEPLSQRRLTTFGGFAFLQAQVDVVARGLTPFLIDRGIGGVLFVMLLLGGRAKTTAGRWADAFMAALCWLYPIPYANTMAAWTAAVTVLTLLRTVLLADESDELSDGAKRPRLMALAALAVAAGGTFRVNALPVAPLFFAAYYAQRLWRRPAGRAEAAKEVGVLAGVGAAALVPWSVALHAAAGSYLYPLMHGNERADWHLPPSYTQAARLALAVHTLRTASFMLLLPAGALLFVLRRWTAAWLFAAAWVTAGLTVYAYPIALLSDFERYGVPLLIGPAFYAIDRTLRWPPLRRKPGLIVVTAAYFGAVVCFTGRPPGETIAKQWHEATLALTPGAPPFYTPQLRRAYADMQQAVPRGRTIAAMVDLPVLLDMSRNPVYCLDLPGRAEKRGYWPLGGGPERLRAFLAEQDVDYVVWEDFVRSDRMYSYTYWHQGEAQTPLASVVVDVMRNLELMRGTPVMVYDHDGLRVARVR